MTTPTCMCIVGARPNFVKMAPIMRALKKQTPPIKGILVHTGQHYDKSLDGSFFETLQIPPPDCNLEVGSGSHAQQTANIMKKFEPVLLEYRPDCILVVGDVNSTLACALVAVKHHIPIVHVESGLRSFDRGMPEEINRILTDQISDLHFITERSAQKNLTNEGISPMGIHFCGNVMIDTLKTFQEQTTDVNELFNRFGLPKLPEYALLTLHRPSNVDDPKLFKKLMQILCKLSEQCPIIFPVHPRTKDKLDALDLKKSLREANLYCTDPFTYLEMLSLMKSAKCVFTDSGGIQEETTALGIPCITLRENTERPITVNAGTNQLVGTNKKVILQAFNAVMSGRIISKGAPELWDGQAASRICQVLCEWLYMKRQEKIQVKDSAIHAD